MHHIDQKVILLQTLSAGLAPLTFVCADKRLISVAVSEGLSTHIPV